MQISLTLKCSRKLYHIIRLLRLALIMSVLLRLFIFLRGCEVSRSRWRSRFAYSIIFSSVELKSCVFLALLNGRSLAWSHNMADIYLRVKLCGTPAWSFHSCTCWFNCHWLLLVLTFDSVRQVLTYFENISHCFPTLIKEIQRFLVFGKHEIRSCLTN